MSGKRRRIWLGLSVTLQRPSRSVSMTIFIVLLGSGEKAFPTGPSAPGAPDSDSAVPDHASTKATPALNWAGLGVRFGVAWWTLSAVRFSPDQHIGNLNKTLTMLNPTIHFGGDGYFVKIDGAIGAGDHLKIYGLGFYPLNYGYFIAPAHLFPYASLGMAVNIGVLSADGTNPSGWGALAEYPRAALGVKWRPIPFLCGSVEVGYSPRAAGLMGNISRPTEGDPSMAGSSPTLSGKGGTGRAFDVSIGIELLWILRFRKSTRDQAAPSSHLANGISI
jgi:hypothetical protein